MKFKHIIFYFLIVNSLIALERPRGAQELINSKSLVYNSLMAIELESGITSFTDSSPLSIQEIKDYLYEIEREELSESGKIEYDKITAAFIANNHSFNSDIFSISLEPTINLEFYYKNNHELPFIYDRFKRKPLLSAPATFTISDYLTMKVDLKFSQNKGTMSHHNNYSNIPFSADTMDINFPSYGYINTGAKFTEKSGFNFTLGLGERSFGQTFLGSIIYSDYFTGASYANLDLYSPNFKYNMTVTQFNVDKNFYLHELNFRLFKKFQLSLYEGLLVNAPLELRYLNPWTIYHGMSPWRDYEPTKKDPESHTCAYMCIKFNYVPFKFLRIYGLFAQDQFQTAYERNHFEEDTTPNGMGFQFGTESYIPYEQGYFHLGLEFVYTDPYLYIKESPNWSLVRTYSENIGDKAEFIEWMGTPLGPDSIAGMFTFGYKKNKWSIDAMYTLKIQGEMSFLKIFTEDLDWGGQDTTANDEYWVYPDSSKTGGLEEAKRKQALTTPTGIPEYINKFTVKGEYSPLKKLSLYLQFSYSLYYNFNNIRNNKENGAECAFGMSFNF